MGESEVVDFSKLSLEERAGHKNFKARISAYEDLIKIFNRICDDKAPEWSKYTSIIKAAPVDGHASVQEKGLEAALIYLENSSQGPRLAGDMMSGVIAKCLSSTRARVKELGVSVVMMCVEVEKYEIVQEELSKGMENKNPKVVAACVTVFTQAIKEFGAKIFKAKLLAKKLIVLLEDRDKNVRDESKKMVIALWHWIGPAFGKDLSTLKPALLTELEGEYAKVSGSRPQQTRYIRSEQEKKDRPEEEGEVDQETGEPEEAAPEVDPYDLLQPEEILSKLPKDFYEKIEAKKWQERKEALEALDTILNKNPKLEGGDYADLVRALKRVISKDSNVVVVGLAVKATAGLANGLKKKFSPYAPAVMGSLLEKFKEKKAGVLNPLKEAADAVYLCTTLEAISEDTIAALQNKNPAMKTEVSLFLGRAFSKTPNKVFTDKKFMKPFITALISNLNESDPSVRDAAAEALGVTFKAMGEKAITPFLADIEPIKLQKIKDFAEKAVIQAPAKAEPKPKVVKPAPSKDGGKPAAAPAVKKGPTIKKPGAAGAPAKKAAKPEVDANSNYGSAPSSTRPSTAVSDDAPPPTAKPVNPNARVDITTKLGEGLLEKLSDKNWTVRQDGLEKLNQILTNHPKILPYLGDLSGAICQRLQDSNRGLASIAFVVLQNLAGCLGPHCKQHLRQFLPAILAQLGESRVNVRANVIGCLNAWADNTSLEECFQGEMISDGLKLPSPLLRSELFLWLAPRMPKMKNVNKEDVGSCLPVLFSCVEDRNADVRRSANDCVVGFMIHLGYEKMSMQAARLKPASKVAVMAALEKARICLPEKEKTPSTTPQRGKTATGGQSGRNKAGSKIGAPQGAPPGSARHPAADGLTSPRNSIPPTPNLRSPMESGHSPSSSYGSAETLVISPPPSTPLETESVDIMSTEVPMPKPKNIEREPWKGVPPEFRIDFDKIERETMEKIRRERGLPMLKTKNIENNSWNGRPQELSIDFDKIEEKYAKVSGEPMSKIKKIEKEPWKGVPPEWRIDFDKIERETMDKIRREHMPKIKNIENDSWNGLPQEFRIDFDKIEQKYAKVRGEPMPPLVLLPTKIDFLDEPVCIPGPLSSSSPRTPPEKKENLPVKASQSIDMIIVQVANSDLKKSMEALVQLEGVVTDPQVAAFMLTRVDQLLVCITMQMRKILPIFDTCDTKKMTEGEEVFKCIAQVLQAVYKQSELPRKVPMETIKDLVHVCLLVLVHPTVSRQKSAEDMVRYFNILVVRIIERSDLNCSICACMRLMTDALNLPHFNRILELTMKCQWKALKQLTLYIESQAPYTFDIEAMLTEFHIFLKSHPFASWKERDGTPLKTMKTVVHNLVTKLGPAKVQAALQGKKALLDSEAGLYLKKLIERELSNPSEPGSQNA